MKIFLIGFMGSGKTYWGRIWADESHYQFVDLDQAIEKNNKSSITSIFNDSGEEHFRFIESEILRAYKEMDNCIIACGGGTPCFHNNLEWMKENGTSIYLQASPSQLTKRLISEKLKRPLIKNIDDDDLLLFIEKKLQEREAFYLQAQFVVPVDEATVTTIKEIIRTPRSHDAV